jgi:DNA-binding Lrp family transcriptional regulator
VYSVAGDYDLVAIIQSEEYQRLAEIVTEKLQAIDTVTDTTTLMAFRNYKFTL